MVIPLKRSIAIVALSLKCSGCEGGGRLWERLCPGVLSAFAAPVRDYIEILSIILVVRLARSVSESHAFRYGK
jgi:hypothetical protein